MEEIRELIERYGLAEDLEHVIIPLPDKNGRINRCYILKRKFIRIMYPERHYIDYPLEHVITAIIKYPDLLLSEALYLLYMELEKPIPERQYDEKEDTDKRELP